MNQLNTPFPENQEEIQLRAEGPSDFRGEKQLTIIPTSDCQDEKQLNAIPALIEKTESPLLRKVRDHFNVFGGISIIFGVLFAMLFYKTGVGLNVLLFTLGIVVLLEFTIKKLELTIKAGTRYYYTGAILLGTATFLTTNEALQFLNVIGILLLLDLSLLHQFYNDKQWDFLKHLAKMLALPFQSIGAIGMPFMDCFRSMKKTKVFRNEKVRNVFIGVVISIPFLWIITLLLVNADLLFHELAKNVFDTIFQGDIYSILFMILIGFILCYCIICAAVSKAGMEEENRLKKAEASIAATVMMILTFVYLIFCSIQVIYLFAGGLFVLPEGYTFAEYARRGFFELLAVAIINVALMVLCRSLFEESRSLHIVITVMTVCTYIMIASATYRMLLYIGAYHLTFLRVFVLLSLLIIALVLAGVIVAEYNKKFPLFRYSVVVVTVCYIAFSFSKPDYYIAEYLIQHAETFDKRDLIYLTCDLSLDAAPVVLPLLKDKNNWTEDFSEDIKNYEDEEYYDGERYLTDQSSDALKEDYLQRIATNTKSMEFREFNYASYLAKKALEENKK